MTQEIHEVLAQYAEENATALAELKAKINPGRSCRDKHWKWHGADLS